MNIPSLLNTCRRSTSSGTASDFNATLCSLDRATEGESYSART